MHLADDDLNRLVDGRHAPTLQQVLGERVQNDAVLAAHIEAWRHQTQALRAAFNEFADTPPSPWLSLYDPMARAPKAILILAGLIATAFALGVTAGLGYHWFL